jgi:hypothetical protein
MIETVLTTGSFVNFEALMKILAKQGNRPLPTSRQTCERAWSTNVHLRREKIDSQPGDYRVADLLIVIIPIAELVSQPVAIFPALQAMQCTPTLGHMFFSTGTLAFDFFDEGFKVHFLIQKKIAVHVVAIFVNTTHCYFLLTTVDQRCKIFSDRQYQDSVPIPYLISLSNAYRSKFKMRRICVNQFDSNFGNILGKFHNSLFFLRVNPAGIVLIKRK